MSALSYSTDNRLHRIGKYPTVLDADGNLLYFTDGEKMGAYEYDARNRLIQSGRMKYRYNWKNERIETIWRGKVTRYVVDDSSRLSRVLMEQDREGNVLTRYVYGLGLIGVEDCRTGKYLSYHSDQRGSTTILTEEQGIVTDRYAYGIYGEVEHYQGSTHQPFQYNGRDGVMTDANGLYYMRARYYHPELKRFLNRDTVRGDITDGQTFNRYAYVNGDPVKYVDPLGLSKEINPIGSPCPKGKTGTVWDNIEATQPVYDGSQLPKSFNINVNGQTLWVNPNGTKHMLEYVTRDGQHIGTFTNPVNSQMMLTEFESALTDAINNNGLKMGEMIHGGNWEFIIVPPRQDGLNNVIKHARYNPNLD